MCCKLGTNDSFNQASPSAYRKECPCRASGHRCMACAVSHCGNGSDGPLCAMKPTDANPLGFFLVARICVPTTQNGVNFTAMALTTAYLAGPMAP